MALGDGEKIWTGLDVLDGLVQAVNDLAASPRLSTRSNARPVVIGCSPWFTDPDLTDALTRVHSCIVTTKPTRSISPEMSRLQRDGQPVWKLWLRGLDTSGIADAEGHRPVEWMGDVDEVDGHDIALGPIRVAGWRRPTGHQFPIVHAKVALLGLHENRWVDTGYGEQLDFGFHPVSVNAD